MTIDDVQSFSLSFSYNLEWLNKLQWFNKPLMRERTKVSFLYSSNDKFMKKATHIYLFSRRLQRAVIKYLQQDIIRIQ